jgi:predicted lipoprotein with Yx(FWY)xxD motif
MSDSQKKRLVRPSRARRVSGLKVGVVALALALVVAFAAMAIAAGAGVTVTSASSSQLGEQVTVDAQGRTLYALSPETAHHLLCKNSECLKFWPPLTVRSSKTKLKAGPGVHGHLGILHRGNGLLQVTLGGLPLYRYSGDHAKGEANGQHIRSFGGTWHVLPVAGNTSPTPPAPAPTTPTPTTPTPTTPTPTPTTPTPTSTTPSTPPGYGGGGSGGYAY